MFLAIAFGGVEAESRVVLLRGLISKAGPAAVADQHIGHEGVEEHIAEGERHEDGEGQVGAIVHDRDGTEDRAAGDEGDADALGKVFLAPQIGAATAETLGGSLGVLERGGEGSVPVAGGTGDDVPVEAREGGDRVAPGAPETDVHQRNAARGQAVRAGAD